MIYLLETAAFFGIPLAVFIWFIISIVKLVRTPKDDERRKKHLIAVIVSAVIFSVMLLVFVAICILFMIELSHM